MSPEFVRFQGIVRNRRGNFPGVFGLVNGLARDGKLSAEQEAFRRSGNDWYHAHLTDPSDVDPSVYDRELRPGAAAWFKGSATELIERVGGYLELLDAHGLGWERVCSADPGEVIYEDAQQVVVVPYRETVSPGGPMARWGRSSVGR